MRKPCCDKLDTNKGAWSKQEDQKLIDYIRKHGEGSWRMIPEAAGLLRCGKSCRLRWINYLRPNLKRGNFGEDEEDLILKLHALLGNRWSLIAGRLPGRTDNEVKNYWNSHLKRKLKNMGIDPNNHRLRNTFVVHAPQKPYSSTNSASSRLKNKTLINNKCVVAKCSNNCHNGRISDTTSSCLDNVEQPLRRLPDLNLDLALSSVVPNNNDDDLALSFDQTTSSYKTRNGDKCITRSTLLLFQ